MNYNNNDDNNNNNNNNNNVNINVMNRIMENLREIFKSAELFNDLKIYADNLTSINYIFNNSIESIKFYCINKLNIHNQSLQLNNFNSNLSKTNTFETNITELNTIENKQEQKIENSMESVIETKSKTTNEFKYIPINFLPIQMRLKQINLSDKDYKIKFISRVSNNTSIDNLDFKSKRYRQYDNIKFEYIHKDLIKPLIIQMYFFNTNIFNDEDNNFLNLICIDFFYYIIDKTINSLYYCIEDKIFYSIKTDGEIKNINGKNEIREDEIIQDDCFNLQMLSSSPELFFDIFSYYLMTKNNKLKSLIVSFIKEFQQNKTLKKKIKLEFNWGKDEYVENLYKLVNFIKKYSLEQICLNTIKELPTINKLLFGLSSELDFYGVDLYNTFDTYIILTLFVKKKIFSHTEYIKYIKNSCCESIEFNFIFDDKIGIIKQFKSNPFVISDTLIQNKYPYYYKINILCEILYILLYCKKQTTNIESLKLAFIFKKFNYLGKENFKFIFDLFNEILSTIKIETNNDILICKLSIYDDNYFWIMLENYINLIKLETKLLEKLTEINKNFVCSIDTINIYDYQNSMYLLIELIYLNKLNLNDMGFLELSVDEYLLSVLANIRSNKLLDNNYDSDNEDDLDNENNIIEKYISKYISSDDSNNLNNNSKLDMKNYFDKFIGVFMNNDLTNNLENFDNNDFDNYLLNDDKETEAETENENENENENNETNENIEEYFINTKSSNSPNSNNIFLKITDSVDDLINKMNRMFDDKLSDTSDNSDNFDNSNNSQYNQFVFSNDKKFLKYQKYKNKYIKLKCIHQIIQMEYFDINIFIDKIKLNIPINEILDDILNFYKFGELNNDVKDNNIKDNDIKDNNMIDLNNIFLDNSQKTTKELINDTLNTIDYEEIKYISSQIINELIIKIEQTSQII